MGINNIAVIGAGTIGGAIATRLIHEGVSCILHDLKKPNKEELASLFVYDIADIPREYNIFLLCLPDDSSLLSVVNELKKKKETIVIDFTTTSPQSKKNANKLLKEHNNKYIVAPLTGGVRAVRAKQASLIVSGEEKIYKMVLPILRFFSSNIIYLGEDICSASYAKLIHNFVTLSNSMTVITALQLSNKVGIQKEDLFEVIKKGTANSYVVENTLSRTIINNNYKEGFKLKLAYKDLVLVKELLNKLNISSRMLEENIERFSSCIEQVDHFKEIDYPIIYNFLNEKGDR
ncbi:NAD(P)-dependent oxidoreductase [Halalkalibacterium halodurans]|uniref:NAD(P)-dependent oxidoreductase n=1 Tax=Halalkalibacterium halodurans TaxID=86665 RepID=UPI002E21311A|nr:NAD(P)-dependent oxidoreductase [Halalkalibacterium halodurans]